MSNASTATSAVPHVPLNRHPPSMGPALAPSKHPHYIVVYDATGEWDEGSLVDGNRCRQLEARGVILLPVEPRLFHVGNGGYAKRSWGAGYPLDFPTPRMTAPLAIFCTKEFLQLNWRLRLVCAPEVIERVRAGEKLDGILRLAPDTGQPMPHYATYASTEKPIAIRELGVPDEDGGWTLGGSGKLNFPSDAHYGFAFYGTAPGLRVAWAAASTTLAG
jgi:hypothetical protein